MSELHSGFILDGYPRTIPQAEFLDSVLKLDKVVNFELSEAEVIKRISGRRTCKKCSTIYHIDYNPPDGNKCRKCGSEVIQRDDEKPDVVKKRLEVYKKQTEPLISYYNKKGILVNIDACPSIEEVSKKVEDIVK